MAPSSNWSGHSPFKAEMSGSSPVPGAVAVAELAMQRFVRPPDAGSSPISHLRMWCKRVAHCDRNAEARFKSDIFNRYNKTNKNM